MKKQKQNSASICTFNCLFFIPIQDTAGSIRDAGGAFSKKEKAQEDQYFKNLVGGLLFNAHSEL